MCYLGHLEDSSVKPKQCFSPSTSRFILSAFNNSTDSEIILGSISKIEKPQGTYMARTCGLVNNQTGLIWLIW